MCMPPPPHIRPVYRHLFAEERFDLNQAPEQKQFFNIFKKLLEKWSPILQKFLKDDDDQVQTSLIVHDDDICDQGGVDVFV